ncbi:hypothetical protein TNIN_107901 [Trichonephila inaurata madagascariensis]|uniref:Uncharacterized protein n=1 Tax=Trichonephila inaurata madagascariensis TaxID=2747483 RepID=A0A8X7CLC2_9ARAC|nr:hypothetical protein TNIN_107901 [Trichonephila inaurata madagascariensis]
MLSTTVFYHPKELNCMRNGHKHCMIWNMVCYAVFKVEKVFWKNSRGIKFEDPTVPDIEKCLLISLLFEKKGEKNMFPIMGYLCGKGEQTLTKLLLLGDIDEFTELESQLTVITMHIID